MANKQRTLIFYILMLLIMAPLSAERAILDDAGNPTGLNNLNPDPDGEPWIVGGPMVLTPEEESLRAQIPELTIPARLRGRNLPAEVIHPNQPEFPPIFAQKGGSCGQASGVGYTYGYQYNVLKNPGVTATTLNSPAYGFTYNFVNRGSDANGSWPYWAWEILETMGCPTAKTFHGSDDGGLSGTRWMDGYDRWHTSNNNRSGKMFRITLNSMSDIETLKSWMYDRNGTDPLKKGGCVNFSSNASSLSMTTVSSGPHAGEKLCTTLSGEGANHAMTFAGYSDSVAGGAVLLVNSWGAHWGGNGTVWVPYTTLLNYGVVNREVYGIMVEEHTPVLEARAKVAHNQRNALQIGTGFSNDPNATAPTGNIKYNKRAFNYCGGAHNIGGKGGSGEIEIALDVSEYYEKMTGNEAAIFLVLNSNGGAGSVSEFSVMDYSAGGEPVQFHCDKSNVSLSGSTVMKVIISKGSGINVTYPNGGEEIEQHSYATITWGDNIDEKVKIDLHKGGSFSETITTSTESDGSYEWIVPEDLAIGDDYTVVITSVSDGSLIDESDSPFSITAEFLITEFPYVQNFDAWDTVMNRDWGDWIPTDKGFDNNWVQLGGDHLDWSVWTGPTPSKIHPNGGGTGPDAGQAGSGNYIFIEASTPNTPSKSANFITPKFSLQGLEKPQLSMWLHMFDGEKMMGTLAMDILVDGTWHNDVLSWSGDRGDEWFLVEQDLSAYRGNRVQFRFRGVTGTDWASDICIDDFSIGSATAIAMGSQEVCNSLSMEINSSQLTYSIPQKLSGSELTIEFLTLNGRRLFSLKRNGVESGAYALDLNAGKAALASGFYIVKMRCGERVITKSILLGR